MAKFYINTSFVSEVQQSFNLVGKIVEGTIQTGMVAKIPFNSSFAMSGIINRIEFALKGDGAEDLCLCFDCDDPEELELWGDLNIGDETIDIEDAGRADSAPTTSQAEQEAAGQSATAE